jgi:membrane-associated phospholipid phosphatase
MFVSRERLLKSNLSVRRCGLLVFLLLAANATAFGQENLPNSLVHASFGNPFELPAAAESSSASPAAGALPASNEPPHKVSWQTLPFDILHDQKYVWLFPVELAKGKHWVPTLAVVGVTAGLIVADSHVMPYFAKTTDWNRFNENFNGAFTGTFEAAVPVSLYLYGLVRHSSYAEQTAILAGEAYADSAIPHVVIKVISRRYRPSTIPPNGNFSDTFFKSSTTPFGKGSSFPSGHAAGAFSIATVIAQRYGHHRWVPFAAYGIATLFSFSRVPDRAHFPSDVFVGAALGYAITKYDVFRENR